MKRRRFLTTSMLGVASLAFPFPHNSPRDVIIGHGDFRYKVDVNWGKLNPNHTPVKDCHEMVQDSQGRILLLTNHIKNNVIVYDKSGKFLDAWGTEYPGAHGLSLKNEGGEDFLYISDNQRHEIIKTTIDGRVVMTLPYPAESEKYSKQEAYIPTETAIADNGDIYVADGYGSQYILHYNSQGELLNIFGGSGNGPAEFNNAHGIAIDSRNGMDKLIITARTQNKFKYFDMNGQYLSSIDMNGAYVCRPVIHKKQIYSATIWSYDGSPTTGFVSILDENNQVVSAPGACSPKYQDGTLKTMYQQYKIFDHPHDVCIDEDENIYVAQWNANQVYPYKLIRI